MDKRPGEDYEDQIKRLRARMGLTQVDLAERLGVSFPTVNRWENTKSRPSQLSWNRLLEIAGEDNFDHQVAEPEPPPYGGDPPVLDFTANPEIVTSLVEGERLSFGHLANPAFATEIASIEAKNNNPFIGPESDRVIVSVDTLAGERLFARIAETDVEPYEMVVFDEAHKLSCNRGAD